MAHYLLRWQFKDTTAKGFLERPQDRTGPATTLVRLSEASCVVTTLPSANTMGGVSASFQTRHPSLPFQGRLHPLERLQGLRRRHY